MAGDLRDAIALALEGMGMLESAERDAKALSVAVEELVRARARQLSAGDVPPLLLEVEHVLRAQRLASTHVEAALRFVHQLLTVHRGDEGEREQLAAVQADALFALSLRTLASQRKTSDLMEAVVHVIRESFPAPPPPASARTLN